LAVLRDYFISLCYEGDLVYDTPEHSPIVDRIIPCLTIKNVNIPDANFKAYLVGNKAININGDTEIQVSEASAFKGEN
jgi:hypothetical protein